MKRQIRRLFTRSRQQSLEWPESADGLYLGDETVSLDMLMLFLLFFALFLAVQHSLWDLSSLTGD